MGGPLRGGRPRAAGSSRTVPESEFGFNQGLGWGDGRTDAGAGPGRPLAARHRPPGLGPRPAHARDALVAAARTVLERDGYAEARITDITAEAGVGTGSFYTHFTGKDEVFAAVMAELQDEMLHPHLGDHADGPGTADDHDGDGGVRSDGPVGSIRRAHVAYLSAYRDNARFMALVDQVAALNPDLHAARLARGDAFAERNAGLIRRLQDQGLADPTLDPLPTAHALNAMASRMANLVFVPAYPLTFDELTDTITHLWAKRPRSRPLTGRSRRLSAWTRPSPGGDEDAVEVGVDVLVVEGDEALDLGALGDREPVGPGDVGDQAIADVGRPVRGDALVRALRGGVAVLEQLDADIGEGQVAAHRQVGLEQQAGPGRLGEHHAVELDAHVARAVEDVDSVVRVAGCTKTSSSSSYQASSLSQ